MKLTKDRISAMNRVDIVQYDKISHKGTIAMTIVESIHHIDEYNDTIHYVSCNKNTAINMHSYTSGIQRRVSCAGEEGVDRIYGYMMISSSMCAVVSRYSMMIIESTTGDMIHQYDHECVYDEGIACNTLSLYSSGRMMMWWVDMYSVHTVDCATLQITNRLCNIFDSTGRPMLPHRPTPRIVPCLHEHHSCLRTLDSL